MYVGTSICIFVCSLYDCQYVFIICIFVYMHMCLVIYALFKYVCLYVCVFECRCLCSETVHDISKCVSEICSFIKKVGGFFIIHQDVL